MTPDQTIVLLILLTSIAMFLWGRWRHDMVAVGALLACVFAGITPPMEAFSGFSHPAVITVACVLVMSHGLQVSGAVDVLTQRVHVKSLGPIGAMSVLTLLAAVMSAFMNNVGALALLMPVAVKAAQDHQMPPGRLLMPLAFGSILGGMTTLIGTPPNLIVSGFRGAAGGDTFAMFDFLPVGAAVAAAGLLFVVAVGWRLVPARKRAGADSFETAAYMTEVRVTDDSKINGVTVREAEHLLDEAGAQVVSLIRHEVRITAPNARRKVRLDDILLLEADPDALSAVVANLKLKLVADKTAPSPDHDTPPDPETADATDNEQPSVNHEDIALTELAVFPGARLTGRSASMIRLRARYGVNLLAISRQGRRSTARLRNMKIKEGDVLLMQGAEDAVAEFAAEFGCAPLAQRALKLPDPKKATIAMTVMVLAVAGAAFGLVPAAISFAAGVLAMMALAIIPRRTVFDSIDWPVIVLLGALIPVAGALAETGAADLIASVLLETLVRGHAVAALALILIVTMTLSDFMNNAATAAVMCPIAISAADTLEVNTDPFLMAVAVGASCAFLTPIGHQNNTLILGPGGFRFGDYWRLGLPIEILVAAVGIPMLLLAWPL